MVKGRRFMSRHFLKVICFRNGYHNGYIEYIGYIELRLP